MVDTAYRGYLITIKSNGENGSRLPIGVDSCYIGANAECEVRLLDADCNDRHGLIKFLPNKHAVLYCLCNEKPVLLNDEPVNENGSPLKNGDIIQIIDVKFKWEENDAYVDTDPSRFSLNIENNSSEEVDRKRFSEPALVVNRKNPIEDEEGEEPYPNCSNINANEKNDETKVTSETTPSTKSCISSSAVETAILSSGNNRSYHNSDSHNQSENNSSQDSSQIRRSRQFCQTYKTKSIANTPDKKKTTPTVKSSFFKNTPLQENNRTLGREVKSRFFVGRNSSIKPNTPLSFVENGEKIVVQQYENCDSNHVGDVDKLEKEVENIVPKDNADIELKEKTLGNETNAEEATFDMTVPNNTVDTRSGLATPRCFTKAFHSTPKAPDSSESELATNLESDDTTNISDAMYGPDDPTKICNLDNNSILASPVKSVSESDVFCKKKMEVDSPQMEPDSFGETRRHHTRSTSNILKKTFEECSENNLPVGEKSLTTPEKLTNECSTHTRNPALIVEDSELDSYSPEKKVDSRKSISGSIRSPLLESTSELSAENGDAVLSFSAEVHDKNPKHDDSSMMAKCSRNLSSFSPPENNRSQEYMDSVVSTPKKPCLPDDEVSLSATTVTTPAKNPEVDEAEGMSTPKTPGSPTRHRRSTGIVPCVGTPSDVYRTIKGGLTPAHKSRFNRTSMEVEVSMGPRDSLSYSAPSRLAPKRSSSERKSTPLKSDKSVARDSLQTHSPIVEEYDLENEESQNESLNNDSQYQFVSKRRRRLAKSSFAIEERILEESEIISSDLSNEDEEVIDEEESLEPLESFDDNSEFVSTRIVVDRTAGNDTANDLDCTYNLDSSEEAADGSKLDLTTPAIKPTLPKSILTPLPRHTTTAVREKSVKKVTFFNLKEDSRNGDVSACSMTDMDSECDSQVFSRVNSSADVSNGVESTSLSKNDSDNEQLYLADKSSDAYSFNSSAENGDSVVQRILAKRNKPVKRLSNISQSKSPQLSGVRRLMNPPRSPKCDYMNVSGVKQLMKTPESLVKPAKKSSLKTPEPESMKTPEPSKETKKTPESRARSSRAIANRQKTPASFGKCAKMSDALAECLGTPKALMKLAKPPEIIVELIETPKKTDVSVASLGNEVDKSVSGTPRNSQACDGDSTFVTPTVRRCSKHLRIHRNSLCLLASSLNSTLSETLSPHDCSASLENSIAELNVENAKIDIMPPPQNPEAVFKVVLIELKEKLQTLLEKKNGNDKEMLENSISMINEVLVDEPVSESDANIANESLQNSLLELEKHFSVSKKSIKNSEIALKTEICKSVVPEISNQEQSVSSQSNGEDEMVVTAAGEAPEDSLVNRDMANVSQSAVSTLSNLTKSEELSDGLVDSTASEEVSHIISNVKNSEEIQVGVSDAVEEILGNVCGELKIDEVSKNTAIVSSFKEAPSNISSALNSDEDVSCSANSVETVNNADIVDSEDTEACMSNVTSFVKVDHQHSLHAESEVILSAGNDVSTSLDAYHSTVEFDESALVAKETSKTSAEEIDEESRVDVSISEPVLMQSSSIPHIAEDKKQLQPNTPKEAPKSILATEEQEIDSENLELFVSDTEEVVSSQSIIEEKSYSKTNSDVAKVTIRVVENVAGDTTQLFSETAKNSLSGNCVAEIELTKSTIPANDSQTEEEVHQKSCCPDNTAVLNDTFKTCSTTSNLSLTAAEVEKGAKTPKLKDSIIAHEKSQQFLDVSASLLVHEENKENLLSLTPIAASAKERSILQDSEKSPAPSAAVECNVTESLLLTLVAGTPEITKSLDPSILVEDDVEENIKANETCVIAPAKLSSTEKDMNISLNSSYPTDVDLDTTCEENLSCVEPSMAEIETASEAETSTNVTEKSRSPATSCEVDEERTTDMSSETLDSSQTSTNSLDTPAKSEVCSTAPQSEVSSSVPENPEVTPVAELPDLKAELMVTPRRCAAVCVSIESQDQLTLAGSKVVSQAAKRSVKSISTSTPIFSDVTQDTMEIPQSCCTTIDPAVSPSEDEAAELSSEVSGTVIDDEKEASSANSDVNESPSKGETILEKIQDEFVSDTSAESQPTSVINQVIDGSQTDSTSISVSQEIVSAAVSKKSVQENGTDGDSEVSTDDDEKVTAPADPSEKMDMPGKSSSRNFSVVIRDTIADLSSAETDSTPLEVTRKNVIAQKSVTHSENTDNEAESVRPKRGRSTRRYTESKGESSTQSNKRTKNTVKAPTSSIKNVSVDLERLEVPQEEEPAKSTQRKTVHFNIQPAVKRPTKPRDLGKLYVPTPKRRRTESKSEDSDDDAVEQLGSPCSIIIRKMEIGNNSASTTTKDLPKRAPRSRSVVPKESVRIRPTRAASLVNSLSRVVMEPKRGTRAKKAEQVLPSKVSAKEESQQNGGTLGEVSPKPKFTAKATKSVAKTRGKTEVAEPPKEEKRSKRKAADELVQNADVAGSSTSSSKTDSKNTSSKAVEVPTKGEKKPRRKAAEMVETKTKKEATKSKKNASQNKDEEPVEVPAKEEKRSRRKVTEDAQEDKKNDKTKASKRATKNTEKNEVSETIDDSNSSSRATRQRKAPKAVVEAAEPPKTAKRAKVDLSTETATTGRATRNRKDALETSEPGKKSSKPTKIKATVASETAKSKGTKRVASVVLDSIDEVASKKRRQSPDPVPAATRTTRNKKNEAAVASSELRVTLKRQKLDEKENKPPVSTKTAADDEVASATNKRKKDAVPTEKVRVTRATRVKEAPQKESSAASTSRVTRSQNVSTLPISRRAKK